MTLKLPCFIRGVKTNIALSALKAAGFDEQQIEAFRGPAEKSLTMELETAAALILRGLEHRSKRVLIGQDARLIASVQRRYPTSYVQILASHVAP